MPREKNLDTLVKSERKRIQMVPGQLVLQPKTKTTVPLVTGGYSEIEVPGVRIETEGENNMGYHTRLLDPAVEEDRIILEMTEELLQKRPDYRTSVDFQIKIIGEFAGAEPWPGYDNQSAEQLVAFWAVMPDQSRKPLEEIMKYELSRVDENGDTITDDEKVKVLNKLYRERDDNAAVDANEGVAL